MLSKFGYCDQLIPPLLICVSVLLLQILDAQVFIQISAEDYLASHRADINEQHDSRADDTFTENDGGYFVKNDE